MIAVQTPYPPGLVAVVTGELSRYVDFEMSMDRLYVPLGTHITRVKGPSVARNRNMIVAEHRQGEWTFFADDDQVITPDTIMRLLSLNLDIVGALYCTKMPPYIPLAFEHEIEPGKKYTHYSWTSLFTGQRVRECVAVGTGGLLIKNKVFDAIPRPWFHWGQDESDDVFFCRRARDHGFKVHVDTHTIMGHTSTTNVWPCRESGGIEIQANWLKVQLPSDSEAAAPVLSVNIGREGEPQ